MVRERVIQERDVQAKQFEENENIHCNAQMSSRV
jgi:hypothetical protein